MIRKIAIIRQLDGGKYRLYSRKKGPDGKRKNLGTFDSLSAAKEHEKDIQYFKHHNDDGMADDKETTLLSKISDIAQYLERAGMVEKAKYLYNVMALIDHSLDDEDNIVDHNLIPDNQRNIGNQGYIGGDGTAGGYSLFNVPESYTVSKLELIKLIKVANNLDEKGETSLADFIDAIIEGIIVEDEDTKSKKKQEKSKDDKEGVDTMVGANGHVGTGVTDNQNAGMFQGFSDAYFYSGYGNLEGPTPSAAAPGRV